MLDRIERQFDCLIDHYIVACIFLALIILTQIGVGDMRTVSMLGLLLCVVGIAQPAAQVDLWILLPLIGFDLIGIASTVAAYGNITDGYGTFPEKKPEYDTAFVFIDDEYGQPEVPVWAIKLVLQQDEI